MKNRIVAAVLCAAWAQSVLPTARCSPLEITYQGQLRNTGQPVNDICDFQFALLEISGVFEVMLDFLVFDGTSEPPLMVADGLFATSLAFDATAFNAENLFIEIAVRCPHDPSNLAQYSVLLPRQPLTAAPYSLQTRGIHVDAAGDVGIGTDIPLARLHLADVGDAPGIRFTGSDSMSADDAWAAQSAYQDTLLLGRTYWRGASDGTPDYVVDTRGAPGALVLEGIHNTAATSLSLRTGVNSIRLTGLGALRENAAIEMIKEGSPGVSARIQFGGAASPSSHSGNLSFWTRTLGDALTEKMRLSEPGNLGIGTGTPGYPLSFPNTLGDKIALWGQSGNHYGFGVQNALFQIYSDTSGSDIAFGFGSSSSFTERMRIEGSGRVGIGTTAPGQLLHLRGVDPSILIEDSGTGAAYLRFNRSGAPGENYIALGGGNRLFFKLGGADLMFLEPTGELGLGTATPASRLHIVGAGGVDAITAQATDATYSRLALRTLNNEFFLQTEDQAGDWIGVFQNGGTSGWKMVIEKDSGEVGIGTTAPASSLHIQDTGLARIRVESSTNQAGISFLSDSSIENVIYSPDGTDDLRVFVNNSDRLAITSAGNVGIGINSPTERLHVNGNAHVQGQISTGSITRYHTIHPASFLPDQDAFFSYSGAGGEIIAFNAFNPNPIGEANCGVELPHGAVITEFRIYADDSNAEQNLSAILVREHLMAFQDQSFEYTTIASVSTSGSPGPTQVADSTITLPIVDNTAYGYWIRLEWQGNYDTLSFRGVRITYTITAPLP